MNSYFSLIFYFTTAAVAAFVIPYLKEKIGESRYNAVKQAVRTLVSAAEQLYGDGYGEQKKAYVLSELFRYTGVTIDGADALIEAEVYHLNAEKTENTHAD